MQIIHTAVAFVGTHGVQVGAGLGLALGSVAASLGAVTYVLVRMPADYLNKPTSVPLRPEHHGWRRTAAKYGRNVLGVALIGTGVVLAVPSIPPGKSMILIGVMVLDFPGKRRLERRIFGRPKVLTLVNRLRARFGRPPLQLVPAAESNVMADRSSGGTRATAQRARGSGRSPIETRVVSHARSGREAARKSDKTFGGRN